MPEKEKELKDLETLKFDFSELWVDPEQSSGLKDIIPWIGLGVSILVLVVLIFK